MEFFIKNKKKWLVHLIIIAVVFAFAFWLAIFVQDNLVLQEAVGNFGYLGVFLASFFSGLGLIIPIPVISFLPLFLEAGLHFWVVLVIMVLGITTADITSYIFGLLGRRVVLSDSNKKIVIRLDKFRSRYYWGPLAALFLYAVFVPLPNELLIIPLGFMGYKVRYILPILLLGNSIFHTVVAFGVIGLFNTI